MACNFILIKGKNKGNNCKNKEKHSLNNKKYCLRHFKILNTSNILNNKKENLNNIEIDLMKLEDTNINSIYNTYINNLNLPVIKGFTFIKLLNNGSFGDVYQIQDNDTKLNYAIKLSKNTKKSQDLLYFEFTLLFSHFNDKNVNYFPKLLSYPKTSYKKLDRCSYMILELFEEDILDRYNRYSDEYKNLSETQVKSYILQIIDIIEYIHSKHYVYIDIKPENFMFTSKDSDVIKIVDFGLCRKYVDFKGNHIKCTPLSNRIGTDSYSSIRMMSGKHPSRIDDLECIGYLLLSLYHNQLPWFDKDTLTTVLRKKKNITENKLYINSPDYIKNFINLTREHTQFELKPNYNQFKQLLQ